MKAALILVFLTANWTWAHTNLTDREVLKQEIFVQKLASRISDRSSHRVKREITSIQHPQSLFAKDYKAKQDPSSLMEPTNGHCARKSFTVNFDEIGWSHILAPKQIEYFYCEGVCDPVTVGPRVFTTSAAFVLYKLGLSPGSVIDGSCCSPSHLSSLELLVQTQPDSWDVTDNPMANLEVVTIPDMLVTNCGCN